MDEMEIAKINSTPTSTSTQGMEFHDIPVPRGMDLGNLEPSGIIMEKGPKTFKRPYILM